MTRERAQAPDAARGSTRRRGMLLALVGPDGVGKSTTLEALAALLQERGYRTVVRHWRPSVLPAISRVFRRGSPTAGAEGVPPRREAGRLFWLRMAYYFIDFSLGYWIKDWPAVRRGEVVLYDRHAIDMLVDPVRYGLSSVRGAGPWWRLIPRPDCILLCFDAPARISERKAELDMHEIADLLQAWRICLDRGQIDAILRIDARPETLSRRIAAAAQTIAPDLRRPTSPLGTEKWARGILALASADNGPGSRYASFGISASQGVLLVDLFNRRTAAASLRLYNAQGTLGRALLGFLAAALRMGLGSMVPSVRLNTAASPVLGFVKQALGDSDLRFAMSTNDRGGRARSVILAMRRDGEALGFAKAGNDPAALTREHGALRRLAALHPSGFDVPRVLAFGTVEGVTVLLQSPPPPGPVRRPPRRWHALCQAVLMEMSGKTGDEEPWRTSAFRGELASRIEAIAEAAPYEHSLLSWGLENADRLLADGMLLTSMRHGDFAPWNMRCIDGRLFIFDWENASEGTPVGWDFFHFRLSTAVLLGRRGHITAPPTAGERSALEELGLPEDQVPHYRLLYLLDALSADALRSAATGRVHALRPHWTRRLAALVLEEELRS